MRITLEVDRRDPEHCAPGGPQCSGHGSPSMFSAQRCFLERGEIVELCPRIPPLPRMLTEQTLKTSRDDSAFLRVCGFNFESTLF